MGLAGPKNRTKLSRDPNNTHWSRDTTGFGHRILSAKGWTPGQNLGARDAPHAALHTAASAGHIRVALKDDVLGVGAKPGRQGGGGAGPGECTGLDAFKDLLGRLNGEDVGVIEKRVERREDAKRRLVLESRWGVMRFVSAGWLVGDKIEVDGVEGPEGASGVAKTEDLKAKDQGNVKIADESHAAEPERPRKKRRVRGEEDTQVHADGRSKKSRKHKDEACTTTVLTDEDHAADVKSKRRHRKDATISNKTEAANVAAGDEQEVMADDSPAAVVAVKVKKSSKSSKKKSKRATLDIAQGPTDSTQALGEQDAKTKRKKKSSERLMALDSDSGTRNPTQDTITSSTQSTMLDHDPATPATARKLNSTAKSNPPSTTTTMTKDSQPPSSSSSSSDSPSLSASASASATTSASTSTPAPPTPLITQGRHAVRARNIAQKRMASMDAAALKQIFMIKSKA